MPHAETNLAILPSYRNITPVGHDAKSYVHAIISPKPSERTRLFLPIPTLHVLVCPLLHALSRGSNEPGVAITRKSKKFSHFSHAR